MAAVAMRITRRFSRGGRFFSGRIGHTESPGPGASSVYPGRDEQDIS